MTDPDYSEFFENLDGIISYKNVDSCNNFGCSVKEWYCGDDSSAQVEVIRCEDGCFEGACLQESNYWIFLISKDS